MSHMGAGVEGRVLEEPVIDSGVYDIGKMLYLLGNPQPTTVSATVVALICP